MNVKIKNQLNYIQETNNFFATLPEFTKKVENISNDLGKLFRTFNTFPPTNLKINQTYTFFFAHFVDTLQKHIVEIEDFLVIFEDLVEVEEMKQNEVDEQFKYTSYIERKTIGTELLKSKTNRKYIYNLLDIND